MTYIAGMQTVTAEWLQSIEVLSEVPVDQLQWMIDNSQHLSVPAGEVLFREGDISVGTTIVIAGKIRLYIVQQQELREVSMLVPKDISGYLPFSRAKTITVNSKVLEDVAPRLNPPCQHLVALQHDPLFSALLRFFEVFIERRMRRAILAMPGFPRVGLAVF